MTPPGIRPIFPVRCRGTLDGNAEPSALSDRGEKRRAGDCFVAASPTSSMPAFSWWAALGSALFAALPPSAIVEMDAVNIEQVLRKDGKPKLVVVGRKGSSEEAEIMRRHGGTHEIYLLNTEKPEDVLSLVLQGLDAQGIGYPDDSRVRFYLRSTDQPFVEVDRDLDDVKRFAFDQLTESDMDRADEPGKRVIFLLADPADAAPLQKQVKKLLEAHPPAVPTSAFFIDATQANALISFSLRYEVLPQTGMTPQWFVREQGAAQLTPFDPSSLQPPKPPADAPPAIPLEPPPPPEPPPPAPPAKGESLSAPFIVRSPFLPARVTELTVENFRREMEDAFSPPLVFFGSHDAITELRLRKVAAHPDAAGVKLIFADVLDGPLRHALEATYHMQFPNEPDVYGWPPYRLLPSAKGNGPTLVAAQAPGADPVENITGFTALESESDAEAAVEAADDNNRILLVVGRDPKLEEQIIEAKRHGLRHSMWWNARFVAVDMADGAKALPVLHRLGLLTDALKRRSFPQVYGFYNGSREHIAPDRLQRGLGSILSTRGPKPDLPAAAVEADTSRRMSSRSRVAIVHIQSKEGRIKARHIPDALKGSTNFFTVKSQQDLKSAVAGLRAGEEAFDQLLVLFDAPAVEANPQCISFADGCADVRALLREFHAASPETNAALWIDSPHVGQWERLLQGEELWRRSAIFSPYPVRLAAEAKKADKMLYRTLGELQKTGLQIFSSQQADEILANAAGSDDDALSLISDAQHLLSVSRHVPELMKVAAKGSRSALALVVHAAENPLAPFPPAALDDLVKMVGAPPFRSGDHLAALALEALANTHPEIFARRHVVGLLGVISSSQEPAPCLKLLARARPELFQRDQDISPLLAAAAYAPYAAVVESLIDAACAEGSEQKKEGEMSCPSASEVQSDIRSRVAKQPALLPLLQSLDARYGYDYDQTDLSYLRGSIEAGREDLQRVLNHLILSQKKNIFSVGDVQWMTELLDRYPRMASSVQSLVRSPARVLFADPQQGRLLIDPLISRLPKIEELAAVFEALHDQGVWSPTRKDVDAMLACVKNSGSCAELLRKVVAKAQHLVEPRDVSSLIAASEHPPIVVALELIAKDHPRYFGDREIDMMLDLVTEHPKSPRSGRLLDAMVELIRSNPEPFIENRSYIDRLAAFVGDQESAQTALVEFARRLPDDKLSRRKQIEGYVASHVGENMAVSSYFFDEASQHPERLAELRPTLVKADAKLAETVGFFARLVRDAQIEEKHDPEVEKNVLQVIEIARQGSTLAGVHLEHFLNPGQWLEQNKKVDVHLLQPHRFYRYVRWSDGREPPVITALIEAAAQNHSLLDQLHTVVAVRRTLEEEHGLSDTIFNGLAKAADRDPSSSKPVAALSVFVEKYSQTVTPERLERLLAFLPRYAEVGAGINAILKHRKEYAVRIAKGVLAAAEKGGAGASNFIQVVSKHPVFFRDPKVVDRLLAVIEGDSVDGGEEALKALVEAAEGAFNGQQLQRMISAVPQHPRLLEPLRALVQRRRELFTRQDAISIARAVQGLQSGSVIVRDDEGGEEVDLTLDTLACLLRERPDLFPRLPGA